MAEQLGLDQGFGQRGAVHGDQRLVPAARQAVKAFGDEFFTRTALADHKHGAVHGRSAGGAFDRVEEGPGLADELALELHIQTIVKFPNAWQ